MSYPDRWTDAELEKLERRIRGAYKVAMKDMASDIDAFFNGRIFTNSEGEQVRGRSLSDKAAAFRKLVDSGQRTEADYKQWLLNQAARGKRYEAMRDKLADRLTDANATAIGYVNKATPGIYCMNRNYEAYTIEQVAGASDFTLWDEATVKRLLKEAPDTMPYYPPDRALKRGIDLEYGKSQITKSVTAGILSGASIPDIATSLRENIVNMGYVSSVRAARTAVTGAQNAGRMDTYRDAERMGLKLKRQWVATLDGRTRHAHQVLDGMVAADGEMFEVGGDQIEYPGDPGAPGYLVYNCRCTLRAVFDDVKTSGNRRARNLQTGEWEEVPQMTYREWAEIKRLA